MKSSNKCPMIPISDIEKIEIDKELLKKALSKPENIAKIMEVNQRIAKELGLGTDETLLLHLIRLLLIKTKKSKANM